MPSVKLKPCPFCNGKPKPAALGFHPDPPAYYVYCDGCGASSRWLRRFKQNVRYEKRGCHGVEQEGKR